MSDKPKMDEEQISAMMVRYDFADLIREGKIPVDLNGHFKSITLQKHEGYSGPDGFNHNYILDQIANNFCYGLSRRFLNKLVESTSRKATFTRVNKKLYI
jgi:hypothetical protein